MQTSGKNSPKGHVAELKKRIPFRMDGKDSFWVLLMSLSRVGADL